MRSRRREWLRVRHCLQAETDGGGFAVIKVFGGSDGAYPNSTLIQGTDGAMYGTTDEGGSANKGVVYKLGTDGSAFAVLWNFGASAVDGASPRGALMQGTDGALYGTTRDGGLYVYGTVFKLNPA